MTLDLISAASMGSKARRAVIHAKSGACSTRACASTSSKHLKTSTNCFLSTRSSRPSSSPAARGFAIASSKRSPSRRCGDRVFELRTCAPRFAKPLPVLLDRRRGLTGRRPGAHLEGSAAKPVAAGDDEGRELRVRQKQFASSLRRVASQSRGRRVMSTTAHHRAWTLFKSFSRLSTSAARTPVCETRCSPASAPTHRNAACLPASASPRTRPARVRHSPARARASSRVHLQSRSA